MKLQELLTIKDNDYSVQERIFKQKTGLNIRTGYKKIYYSSKSCTVIIPFFSDNHLIFKKCLLALQNQTLPCNYKKKKIEVIIVNDGAPIDLEQVIGRTHQSYPITYLKLKRNYGRSVARNLGLFHAQNEIIVFLDPDIVVPKSFLGSHLLRHEFVNKCIIVGFCYKIGSRNPIIKLSNLKNLKTPNYKDDFRYKKFIPLEWKDIYKNVPIKNFNKVCHPLKESNHFKNFGKGKIFGVWDLPFMFLTGNVSVPKNNLLKVGGFDHRFKGWGLEDIHLGAKLITSGLYLIPNLHATAYHVSGKVKNTKQIEHYKKNLNLYNKLKKQEEVIYLKENKWKEKMKRYFRGKLCLKMRFNL